MDGEEEGKNQELNNHLSSLWTAVMSVSLFIVVQPALDTIKLELDIGNNTAIETPSTPQQSRYGPRTTQTSLGVIFLGSYGSPLTISCLTGRGSRTEEPARYIYTVISKENVCKLY